METSPGDSESKLQESDLLVKFEIEHIPHHSASIRNETRFRASLRNREHMYVLLCDSQSK
jgi:hypothetical protein